MCLFVKQEKESTDRSQIGNYDSLKSDTAANMRGLGLSLAGLQQASKLEAAHIDVQRSQGGAQMGGLS